MQKWEYKWESDAINASGAEGWEAVACVKYEDGIEVLMKRPIGESVEMMMTEFVECGVWMGKDSQWLEDSSHRVITGTKSAMRAQASNLGPSWKAEARALPSE